jgi:DNA-binding CsgD family transcriptional regulator
MTTASTASEQADQRRAEARRLLTEEQLPYTEIARRLGVSGPTVHKYCRGLPPPANEVSRASRSHAARSPDHNTAQNLERHMTAYQLRVQGLTYSEIGRQIGTNPNTVRNWITAEIERRVGDTVVQMREIENARLDEMMQAAAAVMERGRGSELALKAIDRLLQVARRRAALNGLDSPVRVDLTSVHKTEADLELEELLREAQTRNAVIEGEIVGDPDVSNPD